MIKRSINIDVIRILAGFFVVVIHVSNVYLINPALYASPTWFVADTITSFSRVSVPLFLMISGYLNLFDTRYSRSQFLFRRLKRIAIPFAFWSLLYVCWQLFRSHTSFGLQPILNRYITGDIGNAYFLFIIAEMYLLTPFFNVFLKHAETKDKKYLLYMAFGFSFLNYFLDLLFPSSRFTTNILNTFLVYIGYYYAGYYFATTRISREKKYLFFATYILLSLINAVAYFIGTNYDRSHQTLLLFKDFNSYFYNPFSLFVIPMSLLFFVAILNVQFLKKIKPNTFWYRRIVYLSSTIFGIFLVQPFVIVLLDQYIHNLFLKIMVVFVVSYLVVSLLKKIKFVKALVGD